MSCAVTAVKTDGKFDELYVFRQHLIYMAKLGDGTVLECASYRGRVNPNWTDRYSRRFVKCRLQVAAR